MSFTPRLPRTTPRLTLRFTDPADAEAMLHYKSQPDVVRYVPYAPLSLAQISERLSDGGRWAQRALQNEGDAIALSIIETKTGRLVGDVVLMWPSETHKVFEIGYILAPEYTGRGYATEAAGSLLAIAFDECGAHRVIAQLDARNETSVGVLERLGMRREAHHVADHWGKGEWSSTLVYAMTEDEWPDSPARASGNLR